MATLVIGEPFPRIEAQTIHEEPFTLPEDLEDRRFILLLYRGKW